MLAALLIDDVGSKRLWNVRKRLSDRTAWRPETAIFTLPAMRTQNLTEVVTSKLHGAKSFLRICQSLS
jgi:hypothetical protein